MARITIQIDEDLARRLEALADEEGRSLEEATAMVLERGLEARSSGYRLDLDVWETELRPGVDLTDRSDLDRQDLRLYLEGMDGSDRPWDRISDLAGSARGGPPDLARQELG